MSSDTQTHEADLGGVFGFTFKIRVLKAAEDELFVCWGTEEKLGLSAGGPEHHGGTNALYSINLCTTRWELYRTPLKYFVSTTQVKISRFGRLALCQAAPPPAKLFHTFLC